MGINELVAISLKQATQKKQKKYKLLGKSSWMIDYTAKDLPQIVKP